MTSRNAAVIEIKASDLPELMAALHEVTTAIEKLKGERDRLKAKLVAIREIAVEAVNEYETPDVRLAMIVRLCDFAEGAEKVTGPNE